MSSPLPAGWRLTSIIFKLPVPPSVNNLYVNHRGSLGGKKGRVKGAFYRAWLHDAGWEIRRQTMGFEPPMFPGTVAVDIKAPLNRRRDLDNSLKALLDVLVKMGIIVDDCFIDDLRIRRVGTGDYVTVEITSL